MLKRISEKNFAWVVPLLNDPNPRLPRNWLALILINLRNWSIVLHSGAWTCERLRTKRWTVPAI
jgi:hypothetical protein